jgi:hypothetical protein
MEDVRLSGYHHEATTNSATLPAGATRSLVIGLIGCLH